jgi:hypothetical protein
MLNGPLRVLSQSSLPWSRSGLPSHLSLLTDSRSQCATAIEFLKDMKPRVERMCCQKEDLECPHVESTFHYVRLHIPATPPEDTIHVALISTYLSQSISTLPHILLLSSPASSSAKAPKKTDQDSDTILEQSLNETLASGTLLQWSSILRSQLPPKQYNNLLMRAYSNIIQSSASYSQSHPRTVFSLRLYSLMCLLETIDGAVEPDTFWNQANKFFTSVTQKTVTREGPEGKVILSAFDRVQRTVEERDDASKFFGSSLYIKFSECRLECATKVC